MDYVKVYRYQDAPDHLKKLSTNGGDEDWIAVIPENLAEEYFPWMEEGTVFGCCCVDEYEHPFYPGCKVRIGCHA